VVTSQPKSSSTSLLAFVATSHCFVSQAGRWAEFGKAHHEFFAKHPPATSMVEVKSLIDPRMLIEIEVDAIITDVTD
jgi:enamine deaminase RidA (YjgF/YER057c/UK114 family)